MTKTLNRVLRRANVASCALPPCEVLKSTPCVRILGRNSSRNAERLHGPVSSQSAGVHDAAVGLIQLGLGRPQHETDRVWLLHFRSCRSRSADAESQCTLQQQPPVASTPPTNLAAGLALSTYAVREWCHYPPAVAHAGREIGLILRCRYHEPSDHPYLLRTRWSIGLTDASRMKTSWEQKRCPHWRNVAELYLGRAITSAHSLLRNQIRNTRAQHFVMATLMTRPVVEANYWDDPCRVVDCFCPPRACSNGHQICGR